MIKPFFIPGCSGRSGVVEKLIMLNKLRHVTKPLLMPLPDGRAEFQIL
jgi:hypothetical protein